MYYLITWIVWLLLLLVVAYKFSSSLLTPQVGFIGCFLPQAIYAIAYVDKWDLNLSAQTMIVLLSGTLLFLLSSLLLSFVFRKIGYTKNAFRTLKPRNNTEYVIHIEKWKIIALLLVQLLTLYFMLRYVNRFPGDNFFEKLYYLNHTMKRVEDGLENAGYALPRMLSMFRSGGYYAGFIVIYLLMHSIIYKYKTYRLLLICSIIFSLLSTLLLGHRFGAIALIVSGVVQWYLIYSEKTNKRINTRIILRGITVSALCILLFTWTAALIGKSFTTTISDYIALYLSAPLKNLDTYIRVGNFGCEISNWQTLYGLVNSLAEWFGVSEWKHFYDQPFCYYNGINLGNVYTTFYWYLHDGGYIALVVFTIIMAFLSQIFFWEAKRPRKQNSINLSKIIYSYAFYGIVFSFFCERFFGVIVSTDFITFFVFLVILKFFFQNICVLPRKASKRNNEPSISNY